MLPPVRAALGIGSLNGIPIPSDTLVFPRLVVLAMGWSWSFYFSQKVVENLMRSCGTLEGDLLRDDIAYRQLCPDSLHGSAAPLTLITSPLSGSSLNRFAFVRMRSRWRRSR